MEKAKEKCPTWAEELIEYLRKIEVFRGTIPDKPNWHDETLKSLASRITSEEIPVFDDDKLEFLFKKIATQHTEAGFSASDIAKFINERVQLAHGPQYCNADEVLASLNGSTKIKDR